MKKFCDILLVMLIIIAIVVGILICNKYIGRQKNEKKLSEIVSAIENIDVAKAQKKQEEIKIEGYEVEGIIEIPKINIKYPIINETNDAAMKVSITKFWGNKINEIGNYTMAGHNNKDGTMFGKTKYLEIGDTIKMTDLSLNTVEYEIFKIYTIDPDDVTCVESIEPGTREITLITCTNGHKNRLITKAREIES